ncbi:hypothetical protein A3D83_02235 [Candidatus Daviesbacteria bacterium RIFCSPHIGHO2_02_FULL_41_10]|uniref:site-specific DNA-methyltransferase (adenine-specific) n=2 Tax=Candidatus Daviesiibacteriota TaxID=1752718 RepID=A0A1F5ITJ8_9BACT|nr:MAG: hypothetical protein A2871_03395 [Candidatus Daviesbacteria bacterium RIFCSPHIGHO2_01_FULL_41_23]OGE32448.1 MAG: hypothetical protein A3D83_02235 [Candidatus Daviesbacteria bacterium RIFCSPHIGHO2_02_FULL_41_10]OGE61968.1 MAG: hypothetical protein A2967_03210 [Candidatus Daviesbacteria bacterium RIFCSPLOWO2_01_FULL_41_32]
MDTQDLSLVKNKIQSLVDKYKSLDSIQISKYTEEETKKGFIEPLFTALGWDFTTKDEISAEESQLSGGRVDYGFYLEGRIKFYVEAKSLKSDLHNEEYAKQAIRYSWNKGVDWAILTDFESIKVFYTQDPNQTLFSKLVFEIGFDEYINRFDQLRLLSKEALEANELDLYAQKHGKKMQKVLVGDQLYKHLNECRQMLIEKLGTWNEIKDQKLLDEGVQKLLDRLIFIRVAEDRGIEPPTLIPLLRAWESNKNGKSLYESMIDKFRELDNIYNSNLFTKHTFEKWNESPGVTEKVIETFQGKAGYYEYDFKIMPADVLGAVYENYLGHRLAASQKGVSLDKDAKKRKEQGIYYTPAFIVDYIVRNALKPVLDKCRSIDDLKKIKVLDPACGSGSFLIKALELINEKYKDFKNAGDELTKIQILKENIYGVDLDEQAVEIARLNLLLSTLETKMKLPKLDKNIRNGNSLISGSDEELQKYFGKNFRDKKPFNWEEEFSEVFEQGGFDVIIGNPPYVFGGNYGIENLDKEYFKSNFISGNGKINLFTLFIEKSLKLLKNEGLLSFIIPNTFLRVTSYEKMREYVLKNSCIKQIVDLGTDIFEGAVTSSIIILFEKQLKNIADNAIEIKSGLNGKPLEVRQREFNRRSFVFSLNNNPKELQILSKLEVDTTPLGNLCSELIFGVVITKNRNELVSNVQHPGFKPFLEGKDISRYHIRPVKKYLDYTPSKIHRPRTTKIFESKEKLLIQRITGGDTPLKVAYDNKQFYNKESINNLILKNNVSYSIKYILGILNSKLINWFYKTRFTNASILTVNISKEYLAQIPIKEASNIVQRSITAFADKMLLLNNALLTEAENSNKWHEIKTEIERTNTKIDEEVYKLYCLTPEEIAIVGNYS